MCRGAIQQLLKKCLLETPPQHMLKLTRTGHLNGARLQGRINDDHLPSSDRNSAGCTFCFTVEHFHNAGPGFCSDFGCGVGRG